MPTLRTTVPADVEVLMATEAHQAVNSPPTNQRPSKIVRESSDPIMKNENIEHISIVLLLRPIDFPSNKFDKSKKLFEEEEIFSSFSNLAFNISKSFLRSSSPVKDKDDDDGGDEEIEKEESISLILFLTLLFNRVDFNCIRAHVNPKT